MKKNWQWYPGIDAWIPESQDISNMTSRGISYQYMPPVTDMYAGSESEEQQLKMHVAGHGKMSVDEVKRKIADFFKQCETLATSDSIKDIERLEYQLNNPVIINLIKQLTNHLKTLKSKAS